MTNYLLGAVACIVLGIALLIDPLIITDVLGKALGVIFIVWAVIGILGFFISRSRGGEATLCRRCRAASVSAHVTPRP